MSIRDFFRSGKQKQVEKELYEALRKGRPFGLEIPIRPDDPTSAVLVLAAEQLIKDRRELTIVKAKSGKETKETLTLYFRADLDTTVSRSLRDALMAQNVIE